MAAEPARRLRLVQVMASGPGRGGIEKHFFELCNRLAERHCVVAVCHPAYRAGLHRDVEFESLGRLIGRRNPVTVARLVAALKRQRPDIVHAHASRAAEIVTLASVFSPTIRVVTVHGLKRHPYSFRGFHRVIAVSRGVASQLRGIPCEVIYNGIGFPQFSGPGTQKHLEIEGLRGAGERPVAVAVGRLDEVKGFDVLIDAWRGIDALLWIVGEGPQRAELEQKVRQRELTDRVKFLGYRNDVPDLLRRADLTVISSRREGFGYTLAEALLLRRAVVSTDVPAANEILPSEYIAPCENAAELRVVLQRTLADPVRTERDFLPVWEQAAAVFTIDAMVSATERVYMDMLATRNCRRAG